MNLPVVEDLATRACATCEGPCCTVHEVPITGFDLFRLTRGLSVPWRSLVRLDAHRVPLFDGFRLDQGPDHHFFLLHRRPSGACQLLVEIPERGGLPTYRRCGVHSLRPGACRVYPLLPDREQGAAWGDHAICPDPARALYRAGVAELQPVVDEAAAERALYTHLRQRWDLVAMRVPTSRPLPPDRFIEFCTEVYRAIEPLRQGERGQWQLQAYSMINEFALPTP